MNYSMIFYILGWIFNFEAVFMILPGITAIIYQEKDGLAFAVTMLICLAVGIPLTRKKSKNKVNIKVRYHNATDLKENVPKRGGNRI